MKNENITHKKKWYSNYIYYLCTLVRLIRIGRYVITYNFSLVLLKYSNYNYFIYLLLNLLQKFNFEKQTNYFDQIFTFIILINWLIIINRHVFVL